MVFFFFPDMGDRQFLSLSEIENNINDTDFLDTIDSDDNIGIVQLPPDKLDYCQI